VIVFEFESKKIATNSRIGFKKNYFYNMRKSATLLLLSFLIFGCQEKIKPSEISKINGYWEIEYVLLSDGSKKDYTINDSFDYFEIKDNEGFRQKVMPQFDGTFLTNNLEEAVKVVFTNDKTYLEYQTAYTKWKEELLSLSETNMVLLNTDKKEFHYKKTGPINLAQDGKKTK
jgi:hypothetical protein